MKRLVQWIVACVVVVGGYFFLPSEVLADVGLSTRLLIPGDDPVLISLPDLDQPLEVRTLRVLPSGAAIAPANRANFTILCPDFTLIEVPAGEEFDCEERSADAPQLVVQLTMLPPPIITPLDPDRGPAPESTPSVEQAQQAEAIQEIINQLSLNDDYKRFVLAHTYAVQGHYQAAIAELEALSDSITDPTILRTLGHLHLNALNYRKAAQAFSRALERSQELDDLEGQALAQHYLAMILELFEQQDEFRQRAREAEKFYRQLGFEDIASQFQQALEQR